MKMVLLGGLLYTDQGEIGHGNMRDGLPRVD